MYFVALIVLLFVVGILCITVDMIYPAKEYESVPVRYEVLDADDYTWLKEKSKQQEEEYEVIIVDD